MWLCPQQIIVIFSNMLYLTQYGITYSILYSIYTTD